MVDDNTNSDTEDEQLDEHANVRFYKLLKVAYNCAKNGYYERASRIAAEAAQHHEEAFDTN